MQRSLIALGQRITDVGFCPAKYGLPNLGHPDGKQGKKIMECNKCWAETLYKLYYDNPHNIERIVPQDDPYRDDKWMKDIETILEIAIKEVD